MAKRPAAKLRQGEPERAERGGRPGAGRVARVRKAGPLVYKVVEVSTVDEGSLEHTVNHWVSQGWNLDGVQFAMRESSKRPSMAFVFFTRDDLAEAPQDPDAARERLRKLSEGGDEVGRPNGTDEVGRPNGTDEVGRPNGTDEVGPPRESDPWKRLAQLAGEDENP